MTEDLRSAMAASTEVAGPGDARVQAWLDAVPALAGAAATTTRGPAWARSALASAGLPAPRRSQSWAALGLAAVAGAGVALVGFTAQPRIAEHLPGHHLRTAVRQVVTVVPAAAEVCPVGEQRFDNAAQGYHLCRPASWVARDYTTLLRDGTVMSVVGFGQAPLPATTAGDQRPVAAPVQVSVTFDSPESVIGARNLGGGREVVVAGQPALEFIGHEADVTTRLVVVQRGPQVYQVEETGSSPNLGPDFEEMVRTFTFQSLPLSADPDLRLDHSSRA